MTSEGFCCLFPGHSADVVCADVSFQVELDAVEVHGMKSPGTYSTEIMCVSRVILARVQLRSQKVLNFSDASQILDAAT